MSGAELDMHWQNQTDRLLRRIEEQNDYLCCKNCAYYRNGLCYLHEQDPDIPEDEAVVDVYPDGYCEKFKEDEP